MADSVSSPSFAFPAQPRPGLAGAWQALQPSQRVRLERAEGGVSWWDAGATIRPAKGEGRGHAFTAVELPEALTLRRTLTLPQLPLRELAEAVRLDVQAASPFAADDGVWGFVLDTPAGGRQAVQVAMASRRQVEAHLAARAGQTGAAGGRPEVWVVNGLPQPAVLLGFGEGLRAQNSATNRAWVGVLSALFAILLIAILLTPALQARARALQADRAFNTLQADARSVLQQREALLASAGQAGALRALLGDYVEPAAALDLVTRALPDDTYLTLFRLAANKATLTGQTSNAATLIQHLSRQPGIKEVRAPTPATRLGDSARESFSIEVTLDPAAVRPARPAAPAGNALGLGGAQPARPNAAASGAPSPFSVGGSRGGAAPAPAASAPAERSAPDANPVAPAAPPAPGASMAASASAPASPPPGAGARP